MGFGGLLKFCGEMNLPRQLAYWLMTRIDPFNCSFTSCDGTIFRLSQNQVHWVLGIPNGGMDVPTYQSLDNHMLTKVNKIRYGKSWNSKSRINGREYIFEGIRVDDRLIARVGGNWEEEEADEFKTLFLLLSLEMLLCPTQSSRLAADLVPALACAGNAAEFDWCSLILKKLMESAAMFARRFYSFGSASGCACCLIFIVVVYLDRLNRYPVQWGYFPRVEVWNMDEIRMAIREDRIQNGGDFGQLGTVDVAYGEKHPCEARDTNGPDGPLKFQRTVCYRRKASRRRRRQSPKVKKSVIPSPKDKMVCIKNFSQRWMQVEQLKRWISDVAVLRLQKICSWVSKSIYCSKELPCALASSFSSSVLAEVVMFTGGGIALDLLKQSIMKFHNNSGYCSYLGIVSEVYDGPNTVMNSTALSRVCVVVKSIGIEELFLIESNSFSTSFSVIKKHVSNGDELFREIQRNSMNSLPNFVNSRNVIVVSKDPNT